MATYSTNLGLTLITTGDEAGTWGTTTNTNLGTLLEQSISGYTTQAVATGTDTTIYIPNGATGIARNMYLELTGTGGASTNLIVPTNKKLYFIYNNTAGAVTVKVSGQTGVSVPAGTKVSLVCNGTDVVSAVTYFASFSAAGIDSTPIGATTPSTGAFTTLAASSTVSGTGFSTYLASPPAIGGTAAAAGTFTNLTVNSSSVPVNGMYLPTANTIGFSTNSTVRARIDASGNVGIGATPGATVGLYLGKNITGGTTSYGVRLDGQVQSDVTGSANYFYTASNVAAGATVGTLYHYNTNQGTFTGAVTTQIGYNVASALTGGTNNYGFVGAIAAGSGCYNLYMTGTADNLLAGKLTITVPAATATALTVTGASSGTAISAVQGATSSTALSVSDSTLAYYGTFLVSSTAVTANASQSWVFSTASSARAVISSTGLAVTGGVSATAIDSTPIGSTTASTGAFTTLTASSSLTVGGVAAVTTARSVSVAGTGLTGGGDLSANRTITIDQTAMTTRNITGKTGITKTLSTSAASGGSDGDIWYRY